MDYHGLSWISMDHHESSWIICSRIKAPWIIIDYYCFPLNFNDSVVIPPTPCSWAALSPSHPISKSRSPQLPLPYNNCSNWPPREPRWRSQLTSSSVAAFLVFAQITILVFQTIYNPAAGVHAFELRVNTRKIIQMHLEDAWQPAPVQFRLHRLETSLVSGPVLPWTANIS